MRGELCFISGDVNVGDRVHAVHHPVHLLRQIPPHPHVKHGIEGNHQFMKLLISKKTARCRRLNQTFRRSTKLIFGERPEILLSDGAYFEIYFDGGLSERS